jgi:hypothetical protein
MSRVRCALLLLGTRLDERIESKGKPANMKMKNRKECGFGSCDPIE